MHVGVFVQETIVEPVWHVVPVAPLTGWPLLGGVAYPDTIAGSLGWVTPFIVTTTVTRL